ncbi:FtsX-like permease family protein [Leeuwenhoekiella sp. NPDC079379]|uniref:FtsX-like permease family protein n=1 Tax=Leeuwenhoekiella sp. NPDC079379 TaxID=3364122 RepID=UPI0037C5CB90
MFRNYIKIAWRNIWKNKLFSAINILSLAIGLSASFVIGVMVYYDFTFDTFHKDRDRIYRVVSDFEVPQGNIKNGGVAPPMRLAVKEDLTGIEKSAYFYNWYVAESKAALTEQQFIDPERIILTEASYFDIFQYTWIAGSKETALEEPNTVVLTRKRALAYFPNTPLESILGKTIVYNSEVQAVVTGLIKDFDKRSDLYFDEFVSLETAKQTPSHDQIVGDNWGMTNNASQLYIKISEKSTSQQVKAQLQVLSEQHVDADMIKYGNTRTFNLQQLSDLHFDQEYGVYDYTRQEANKKILFSLILIAVFLLLLGSINFINLNTAQATQRAKEIGIRKTLGSSKKQVIIQFLGETFLLTVIAAVCSILLSVFALNIFKDFVSKEIDTSLMIAPWFICFVLGLIVTITFLSGFYPALVLSRFKPARTLKGERIKPEGKGSLRKMLTVSQFAIAQAFVIATLLVSKQIYFMMHSDLGFRTDAVAYLQTPWTDATVNKRIVLENKIKAIPQIAKVSLGGMPPASQNMATRMAIYKSDQEEIIQELQILNADTDYLDVYTIDLLAGRKALNDTIEEYVINETGMQAFGFKNPENILGEYIAFNSEEKLIVGVMKDFKQRSLKTAVLPLMLTGDTSRERRTNFRNIHIVLGGDATTWTQIIEQVEQVYKEVYPGEVFKMTFIDETIASFYEQEQRIASLLNWATALSIIISCLGLLGLVIHTTERRTKEIGIRKVLGASLVQLNMLLCADFLKLLVIAYVIAAPVAWWGLHNWLQDYAYKTDMSWWIFLSSGLGMLLLAILIMGFRTLKTARKNPVKSLRAE